MELKLRLRTLWDDLQSSLWYRPAIYTLLALFLAFFNPYIDGKTEWEFYNFGADNARAVLSSIASSMLTVVTLTFSILMVSFTLASQQFSPRILRTFTRDKASQHVLGLQTGTFLYSLLVMVRINDVGEAPYVPLLSVLGAIAFAMLGIGAFLYFIDHISHNIRVNYVIANIGEQTMRLFHQEMPQQVIGYHDAGLLEPALLSEKAARVRSPRAGYIQGIATTRLLEIARENEIVLEIACTTGDFVALDAPLLHVRPAPTLTDELAEKLREQFDIGRERTLFEDVLFGIRQLVDIAIKALSPAVNDPTTTTNCLDQITNILCRAARYPDHDPHVRDESGNLRILLQRVTFEDMVELAFNQIRHYGCDDALVVVRMLNALTEIAGITDDEQRQELLWRHVCMICRSADRSLVEPHERQQINTAAKRAAWQMAREPDDVLLDNAEPVYSATSI